MGRKGAETLAAAAAEPLPLSGSKASKRENGTSADGAAEAKGKRSYRAKKGDGPRRTPRKERRMKEYEGGRRRGHGQRRRAGRSIEKRAPAPSGSGTGERR